MGTTIGTAADNAKHLILNGERAPPVLPASSQRGGVAAGHPADTVLSNDN